MSTDIEFFGADKIGGCVTVISTDTTRIVIDFGEDLPGCENPDKSPFDFQGTDAVFFTHYHGDHIGRIGEIPESVPVYMGKASYKILQNIWERVDKSRSRKMKERENNNTLLLFKSEDAISVGDIRVTPYSADHSAYDAYMFLIETPDKKILHTGDFRAHGYHGKELIPLIREKVRKNGERDIDILITEGTMMSRNVKKVMTEEQMKEVAKNIFSRNRYAFLICSSTNLDSLATFHNAAKSFGMQTFVYSSYISKQFKTFSDTAGSSDRTYRFSGYYLLEPEKQLTHEKWKKPKTQAQFMRDYGFLAIIKPEDYCRRYIEMFIDLKPVIIYSMWDGFLNVNHPAYNKIWDDFLKEQEGNGAEVIHLHTSGHADPDTIAEVIRAVSPKEAIYPIHTESSSGFYDLDIPQELKDRIVLLR